MTIRTAIYLSWQALLNPAVFIRILIPAILSVIIGASLLLWGLPMITTEFVLYLKTFSVIQWIFIPIENWLAIPLLSIFTAFLFVVFVFLMVYFFLIVLTSIILVPLLNPIIQKLYFPSLVQNNELSLTKSIINSAKSIFYFLIFFILLLPVLIFFPGGQFFVPYFLNSYLAKNIFPFDVLQNYATLNEFEQFQQKETKSLWSIALLTGAYFYIPILNLFAAPLMALAYIIYCMGKIVDYRQT